MVPVTISSPGRSHHVGSRQTFLFLSLLVVVVLGVHFRLSLCVVGSEPSSSTEPRTDWHASSVLPVNASASAEGLRCITCIHLLGERNSGTSHIQSVLSPFAKEHGVPGEKEPFVRKVPTFEFKHMFRHSLLNEEEHQTLADVSHILWVPAVRSPCDWEDAVFRTPWHLCLPDKPTSECPHVPHIVRADLGNMTHLKFFKRSWSDWPEAKGANRTIRNPANCTRTI